MRLPRRPLTQPLRECILVRQPVCSICRYHVAFGGRRTLLRRESAPKQECVIESAPKQEKALMTAPQLQTHAETCGRQESA